MARKKTSRKADRSTQVESIRHKDKRANIPTEELRDFVAEDEQQPKTMLYPRDTSLDPQLVWKGKDEQDAQDLTVPVVPVYIQEKIKPQVLIDDLLRESRRDRPQQLDFFADFNGIEEFDKRVEFYQHQANWANRMILGDSLMVMTSLAEKEGLKGKVQCIYIDPPYGIKFASNWQVSTRKRDVKDGKAEDTTRQPEQIRAFRDTWKLGIHSYLAYLRDRLVVARELLTDTGSVFVQIGDENVHLVRCVMDEVFGSENAVSVIAFRKTAGGTSEFIGGTFDFVLWYTKKRETAKFRQLFREKEFGGQGAGNYTQVELPDGTRRPLRRTEKDSIASLPAGSRIFAYDNLTSQSIGREKGEGAASWFPVEYEGRTFRPSIQVRWKTNEAGMKRLQWAQRLGTTGNTLWYVRYIDDFPAFPLNNFWEDTASSFMADKVYVVQTTLKIIERCVLMTTDPGDLVLDPTCGSGTTAYVAEQWGRRWITIDTSRVALALARTRMMAARYPYYLLADSPEGIEKEAEITGHRPPPHGPENDIRKGFVYRRVAHITLKSIAQNPDIKEGMTREEIAAAIARYADQETLYDQPYQDNKRIRVSGPLAVESLSPHRVLSTADDNLNGTVTEQEACRQQDFAMMILDNLKKAGVQNTVKNERMKFDVLEPLAGHWLHAAGEYTDADGNVRRVAVSLGPEHGTVGPAQVKEAAKEAVQGVGYDVLVVCGFAFDPHVSEEAKRYGKLTVLPTRMNPDLAMGDELLKKTGAGNLFTVFGEPDVDIRRVPSEPAASATGRSRKGKATAAEAEMLEVEIKGVDVYDPTTGQIRNSSTADIACWFIDTDYNGESFFVRHAYFTGSDDPYKKLQRALRAEINEDAWASLNSTTSRPFDKPETGKIAIKVINHYGDEVLKVFDV